ncbi:MAG: multicopper oxidase family protein [Gemmatimonadetes bacterium]|nr:multicopper oxidase family protein [Gemmatimonadota bacterium]
MTVLRTWFLAATAIATLAATPDVGPSPAPHSELCTEPEPVPGATLSPSRDLYCVFLTARPGMDGSGVVELGLPQSPFGVAVDAMGRHLYDASLTLEGLPPASELGPYGYYVAWLTTPVFDPVINLGAVDNGTQDLGRIDLQKFLVLITAEERLDGDDWEGRLVLRGSSPSARMSPPDMQEFLLGATGVDEAMPMGHGAHGGGDGWPRPPMSSGLTMLPALMALDPPATAPFLPQADLSDLPLARPRDVVRLADGDRLELEAGLVRRRIRSRDYVMYGFNGQYPGPLIHVDEAATIQVSFTNHVDWPTTIHWHGLRLDNGSDGVPGITQEPVAPGETFEYSVRFDDPGIYWYHPHHREDILKDLGLYGNMLVEPEQPDYYGPVDREEVLMLDDFLMGEEGALPFGRDRASHALMGRFGNLMLVNGEPDYELDVGGGEVVRFYLTNVSNTRTFNLSFEGARLKVVGTDVGAFEREEWVESVVVGPAERYVVHARFDEEGAHPILNRVQGIDHLAGSFFSEADTMGRVSVLPAGPPADPSTSAAFDTLRTNVHAAREIALFRDRFDAPIDLELTFTLEADSLPFVVERLMRFDSAYFHPVEWSGTMPMMNWNSTSRETRWILRDPSTGRENMDVAWSFSVGDVVKIRLHNERRAFHAMQHPFHIHGQRFLVLAKNGIPNENLAWKDTVLLPVGSTVDILLEITNPGRWMAHCHISEHLESGMRTVFSVDPLEGS